MNATQRMSAYFSLALLLIPVLLFTGCGEQGGKKSETAQTSAAGISDGSQVLVTINGTPVITVNSFKHDFDMLLEENPQLKQVLPFMPDAHRNFLLGLTNQEVVNKYISDKKIDQRADYKQDQEKMRRSLDRVLNTKYFAADNPVTVSDSEVKAYYDANKDKMQELVISRGGVQAVCVPFDSEAEAQEFYKKAKNKSAQFEAVVKESKLADKMRDLKLVNKQSVGIDPVLRAKITEMTKFPSVELIKINDKTCWVVNATAKEEAKYRSFEEVKEPLRQLVEREKTNEALQKAIDALKQDMKVVIDEEAFKKTVGGQSDEQQEMAMNEQVEAIKASQAV